MPTKNSFNSGIPIEIEKGGTKNSAFTAYEVVCGGTTTTGALQSVGGLGTATQILTSNGAAALPTFQAAPTGNIDFQQLASDPGSAVDGQCWYNTTSNTYKGQANSATVTFTVT